MFCGIAASVAEGASSSLPFGSSTGGSTFALPNGTVSLISAANPALQARHCSFQLFACHERSTPPEDYLFVAIPALNHAPSAISFQSVNYPDRYISLLSETTGVEAARLGIEAPGDPNDASFAVVPGLSDPRLVSLQAFSPKFRNSYVAINNQLEGVCAGSYSSPSSDIILTSSPSSSAAATWNIFVPPPPPPQNHTVIVRADEVLHTVNPLYMGCHSDSGFTHQPRGLYAQMVFGEVFEFGLWPNAVQSGAPSASVTLDGTRKFNSFPSLAISFPAGAADAYAGVANRGLGNEGLVFAGGQSYEGFLFAQAGAQVQLAVRLEDYVSGQVLAEAHINVPATSNWTRFDFTLTPSASTACEGISPADHPDIDCHGSPGGAHPCVRCGGQVAVVLVGGGSVWLNYVYLQPGQWGRFAGLPVQLEAVRWLQAMGVTSIRQGGSFTIDAYYFWKNWRGPAYERPSLGARWGASLISGWGPFEMIDLCNAAGFEPIITTSAKEAPADLGDLVEYCYGNATTTWGAQRYADGHPEPYRVKVFEIGNEEYPPLWVDQVAAMEERAASLGLPHTITYMFPSNGGPNREDATRAEALGLGDMLVSDLHVGAGGAIPEAQRLFDSNPSYHQGAVNCETNAGTHNHRRALQEAQDLNQFFNVYQPRMKARTASFCMERSGHFDAFDQGLIFFLPNMTWAQPPFYVHQMIHDTWHPQTVNSSTLPPSDATRLSAALSDDGQFLVLRYVNDGGPDDLVLQVSGFRYQPQAQLWQLHSDDPNADNTPASPTRVAPRSATVDLSAGVLQVPALSYTVLLLKAA